MMKKQIVHDLNLIITRLVKNISLSQKFHFPHDFHSIYLFFAFYKFDVVSNYWLWEAFFEDKSFRNCFSFWKVHGELLEYLIILWIFLHLHDDFSVSLELEPFRNASLRKLQIRILWMLGCSDRIGFWNGGVWNLRLILPEDVPKISAWNSNFLYSEF